MKLIHALDGKYSCSSSPEDSWNGKDFLNCRDFQHCDKFQLLELRRKDAVRTGKQGRTEYRIQILNLNFDSLESSKNTEILYREHKEELLPVEPPHTDLPPAEPLSALLSSKKRKLENARISWQILKDLRSSILHLKNPRSDPESSISAQPVSLTGSTPVIPERQDWLQRVSRLRIFQIYFILTKFKVKFQRNHDTVRQNAQKEDSKIRGSWGFSSFYPPSIPLANLQTIVGRFWY